MKKDQCPYEAEEKAERRIGLSVVAFFVFLFIIIIEVAEAIG